MDSKAVCVRKVANWSTILPEHRFDRVSFNPKTILEDMPASSPKMVSLFQNIKQLDEQDLRRDKVLYKHVIYSDVNQMGYGAKILASAFIAKDYSLAYDSDLKMIPTSQKTFNTFALLSSSAIFGRPFTVSLRRQVLSTFNSRPSNVHGEQIRFIILDSGYKEGIDLFDVKYIHIFEPQLTMSDEKQVVGRGTRFCGQQGLHFHPTNGWPLHVFRYEVEIPKDLGLQDAFGASHMFALFLKYSGIDIKKVLFANALEAVAIHGAVDRSLTKAIHDFNIKADDDDMEAFRTLFGLSPDPIDVDDMEIDGGKSKTKPRKTTKTKTKTVTLHPKPPQRPYSYPALRRYIEERFSKYKWTPVKLENLCAVKKGGNPPSFVDFTPSQNFVRLYFQPSSIYKGLLAWHSVGTGKTCTAIATATSSFEREGYSILWVTRHTLKPDIWKNMFQQVCSVVLKNEWKKGNKWPEKVDAPLRVVSKNWLAPISYKQFSNLLQKRNQIYDDMVKRNGAEDPLRKTLVIIDEAHKLFAKDTPQNERPDVKVLRNMIHESYDLSGKDSVRLLLMSATPYTSEPMDLIKLLNLLRPRDDTLPESFEEFSQVYLNDQGEFDRKKKLWFMNDIAGYISYLNREKDARQFAYPVFQNIKVPLSIHSSRAIEDDLKATKDEIEVTTTHGQEQRETKKEVKARLREQLNTDLIRVCKDAKPKKPCKDRVKLHYADEETRILGDLNNKMSETSNRLNELNQNTKTLKERLKTSKKADKSQEKALLEKCKI